MKNIMKNIKWEDGIVCAVVTRDGVKQYRSEMEAGIKCMMHNLNGTPAKTVDRRVSVKITNNDDYTVGPTPVSVGFGFVADGGGSSVTIAGGRVYGQYEQIKAVQDLMLDRTGLKRRTEAVNAENEALKRQIDKDATETRLKNERTTHLTAELESAAESLRELAHRLGFDGPFNPSEVCKEALKGLSAQVPYQYWDGVTPLRVGHIVEHGATVEAIKNGMVVLDHDGFKMAAIADIRTTPIVDWGAIPTNVTHLNITAENNMWLNGAWYNLNNATLPVTVKRPL